MAGHIAQFDEDPRTWAEFIRAASCGSAKAADWATSADMAVAARVGGRRLVDEAPLSEYEQVMGRVLPDTPPLGDLPALLAAARAGGVPARVASRSTPYHDLGHYDRLWQRRVGVAPEVLMHDAALLCLDRWDSAAFREIVGRVHDSGPGYNSQDAVAAMVYLSAISGSVARTARRRLISRWSVVIRRHQAAQDLDVLGSSSPVASTRCRSDRPGGPRSGQPVAGR